MRLLFSIFLTLFYTAAEASYFEVCTLQGKVLKKSTKPNTYQIQFSSMKLRPGSHGGQRCKKYENSKNIITVKETVQLEVQQSYLFQYSYYDSMGPNGLIQSETWSLHTKKNSR